MLPQILIMGENKMNLTDKELEDLYYLRNVKTIRRSYHNFESLNGKIGKFKICGTFPALNKDGGYTEEIIPAYFLAYNCGTGENLNVSLIDNIPYLDIVRVGDYIVAKDKEEVVFDLTGKRVNQDTKTFMDYLKAKQNNNIEDSFEESFEA